ncbi:MAG: phosphogluconate dehydrogenase (NAD(+)-dependent, decarboxylating) [Pseudomonadota bacterium]
MKIALLGLGKMGANMARRLARAGIEVIGYNRSQEIVDTLAAERVIIPARSLFEAVSLVVTPRIIWLMLPSGAPTEQTLKELLPLLAQGDLVVDGGNSNYHDSERRAAWLAQHGVGFVDAGTSGGIWGLENGYCLMVGGNDGDVALLAPVLKALAPAPNRGWAHVGPAGAGHFTKMIHNGIEYGMMQAYAEGLTLLHKKREFALDLAQITELWRHGSVVRSWLLDLTADTLRQAQGAPLEKFLEQFSAEVEDSGEGRWTAIEAVEQGVAAPVMTLALQMRFASRDKDAPGNRFLSLMRRAFGGHTGPQAKKRT